MKENIIILTNVDRNSISKISGKDSLNIYRQGYQYIYVDDGNDNRKVRTGIYIQNKKNDDEKQIIYYAPEAVVCSTSAGDEFESPINGVCFSDLEDSSNFGEWLQNYYETLALDVNNRVVGCIYCLDEDNEDVCKKQIASIKGSCNIPVLVACEKELSKEHNREKVKINDNKSSGYKPYKMLAKAAEELRDKKIKDEKKSIDKIEEMKKKLFFQLPMNVMVSAQKDDTWYELIDAIPKLSNDSNKEIRNIRSCFLDVENLRNTDARIDKASSRLELVWYGIDCASVSEKRLDRDIENIKNIIENNNDKYDNLAVVLVHANCDTVSANKVRERLSMDNTLPDDLLVCNIQDKKDDRGFKEIFLEDLKKLIFLNAVQAIKTNNGKAVIQSAKEDNYITNDKKKKIEKYIAEEASIDNGVTEIVESLKIDEAKFNANFADAMRSFSREDFNSFNVVVMGPTGAGKSTLINGIREFTASKECAEAPERSGTPCTQEMKEYKLNNNITIWDTKGLELGTTKKQIETIKSKIRELSESEKPDKHIHAIWYCINSLGSRVQATEEKTINELKLMYAGEGGLPIICAITQDVDAAHTAGVIQRLKDVGIPDDRIIPVIAKDFGNNKRKGLDSLINATYREVFNKSIKNSCVTAVMNEMSGDLNKKSKEACEYLNKKVKGKSIQEKIEKTLEKIAGKYAMVEGSESFKYINSIEGDIEKHIDFNNKEIKNFIASYSKLIKKERTKEALICGGAAVASLVFVAFALIPGVALAEIIFPTTYFSAIAVLDTAAGVKGVKQINNKGTRRIGYKFNTQLNRRIKNHFRNCEKNPEINKCIEDAVNGIAKRLGLEWALKDGAPAPTNKSYKGMNTNGDNSFSEDGKDLNNGLNNNYDTEEINIDNNKSPVDFGELLKTLNPKQVAQLKAMLDKKGPNTYLDNQNGGF